MKWTVPVLANDIVSGNAELVAANKKVLEGALVAEQTTDLTNEKSKNLQKNYLEKFGKEMPYKSYGQAQYDLVYILKEGLEKFGNDPVRIAEWVRTLKDWDGASGKVTIGSDGDVVGGHVVRVIKDGKVTEVE